MLTLSSLTLPSRGRLARRFAPVKPPLMSNVRALKVKPRIVMPWKVEQSSWAAGEPVDACTESLLSPPVVSTRLNSMSSRVRSQAPLCRVRFLSSGATHTTLRAGCNVSQLLALRAAVLRRAVSQLSWPVATLRVRCATLTEASAAFAVNSRHQQQRAGSCVASTSALTLPSSGHPTAGRTVALRQVQ